MLSKRDSLNSAAGNFGSGLRTAYAHLIGGARPQLKLATCVYFDGIQPSFSVEPILDFVEEWFSRFDCKPKVLLVSGYEGVKLPRFTINTFREAASNPRTFRAVKTIQFFPKGRTTIDDTWRPAVYFAASLGRPASAFFSTNGTMCESSTLATLQQGNGLFGSCAAYAFAFPERFSALGYYWGMSIEPVGRNVGTWGKRESRRLSHWRDNTQIGIADGGERRFYDACSGYVRDVYPLMQLSKKHTERRVGESTLAGVIEQRKLGSLSAQADKFIWRVPVEHLAEAQVLLDDNDISLSGRRLELE